MFLLALSVPAVIQQCAPTNPAADQLPVLCVNQHWLRKCHVSVSRDAFKSTRYMRVPCFSLWSGGSSWPNKQFHDVLVALAADADVPTSAIASSFPSGSGAWIQREEVRTQKRHLVSASSTCPPMKHHTRGAMSGFVARVFWRVGPALSEFQTRTSFRFCQRFYLSAPSQHTHVT